MARSSSEVLRAPFAPTVAIKPSQLVSSFLACMRVKCMCSACALACRGSAAAANGLRLKAYCRLASSWSVRKPSMPSDLCTRSFFFTPILRHISWEGPGLGWGRPGDARDGEGGQSQPGASGSHGDCAVARLPDERGAQRALTRLVLPKDLGQIEGPHHRGPEHQIEGGRVLVHVRVVVVPCRGWWGQGGASAVGCRPRALQKEKAPQTGKGDNQGRGGGWTHSGRQLR
eukprot:scaffold70114_cov42-Phaeocystis_antarctica.AAC.1